MERTKCHLDNLNKQEVDNRTFVNRFIPLTIGINTVRLSNPANVVLFQVIDTQAIIHIGLSPNVNSSIYESRASFNNNANITRFAQFDVVFINSTHNHTIVLQEVNTPQNELFMLSHSGIMVSQPNIEIPRPGITPMIFNINAVLANTEYSQILPLGTRTFSLFIQENDTIYRIAFETGRVATPTRPFIQIPAGGAYSQTDINTDATIFFATTAANRWLQIIAWT